MVVEVPHTDIRRGIYHPDFPEELHDFRNFVAVVWERLGMPVPTWIQDDVAFFLQRGPDPSRSPWESPNDRIMVGGYRALGKSYLTAAFADHCLALDPTLNILVISGSQGKADEFTLFAKRLIEEIPELEHIRPTENDKRFLRWSGEKFDVRGAPIQQAPSCRSASITGTITGSRADIIIPDDIETPINSETQLQRDKLDRLADQFPWIYKEQSRVVYLGTFQCEDSHYVRLPTKGYWMRLWPARYPGKKETGAYCERESYGELLAPIISDKIAAEPERAGQPTDPMRFDEVELQKKENEVGGTSQAELQMGLNPTTSDRMRYPLHLEDLMVMPCNRDLAPESLVYARDAKDTLLELGNLNPGLRGDHLYKPLRMMGEWGPYQGGAAIIDPAGGGPDNTEVQIWKWRNGYVYLLDFMAFVERPEEDKLEEVVRFIFGWGVHHIRVEDPQNDGLFQQALQPIVRRIYRTPGGRGCSIDAVRHGTMKEKRMIGSCEVPMNHHRVVLSERVVEKDSQRSRTERKLLYQMSRVRPIKGCLVWDDALDCMAQAMDYLNEQGVFDVDHRERVEAADEEMQARELEEFMRDTGLPAPAERTFLSHNRAFQGVPQ